MVVDGQIHGGLAEGVGIALMEVISFDEEGNCLNSSFMDYLIPTALECPDFELGETVTPCPHHPLGAKGVGESPNVGSPPAIVNAVIDALHETHGVDHVDMPCTPGARLGGDAGTPRAAAMIPAALTRRSQELAAARIPFVTATVVRAQSPTSVKPGSVALVLEDGTIEGFVGGTCSEQSVRAYSLIALSHRRAGAAADPARRAAGRRAGGGDRRGGRGDRPQPVPLRRGDRDLPRARAAARRGCWSSATPRSPRR